MKFIVDKVKPKIEYCGICGVPLPLILLDETRFHHWVIRGDKVCEECFMREVTGEKEKSGRPVASKRAEEK